MAPANVIKDVIFPFFFILADDGGTFEYFNEY